MTLLFSLPSCVYFPNPASFARLQETRDLHPSQISTIKTPSNILTLSKFQNITKRDRVNANLVYKIKKKTTKVTLRPGEQKFRVSYDHYFYYRHKYITVNVEAGITYTVNYRIEGKEVIIWVVNNTTNLPVTDEITM